MIYLKRTADQNTTYIKLEKFIKNIYRGITVKITETDPLQPIYHVSEALIAIDNLPISNCTADEWEKVCRGIKNLL